MHHSIKTYRNGLPPKIQRTANALAADRATKFLPILVAQSFFIASVGIAIFRTAAAADSGASSDTVFINVEAHSIAFSALYFWIIPAVFLASAIGASQTKVAMPDILKTLEADEKTECPFVELNGEFNQRSRIYCGGVYSWQPSRSQSVSGWRKPVVFPYLIVVLGTITGVTISALVPPDGFDCRHIAQLSILLIWLASAGLDLVFNRTFSLVNQRRRLFWYTYTKDFIATSTTMCGVIATQVGLFNRCVCYTQWGRTGLALPEMPDVAAVLHARLGREYPAITFTSIGLELIVVPLAIWLWYGDAMRVSLYCFSIMSREVLTRDSDIPLSHRKLLMGAMFVVCNSFLLRMP